MMVTKEQAEESLLRVLGKIPSTGAEYEDAAANLYQFVQQSQPVPEGYCNAYEVLGWAHAEFCTMLDQGEDPRQVEVPELVGRMERAFFADATKPGGE